MFDSARPIQTDIVIPSDSASAPIGRRRFLVWAACASLGASSVFIGATVLQAMVPPTRSVDGRRKAGRVVVSMLSELEPSVPHLAEYGQDPVFVVKTSPTRVLVFDAACPHMGCALVFNRKTSEFDCPCHKGAFTLEGVRLRGPAPRNMRLAESTVVNGEVIVTGFQA